MYVKLRIDKSWEDIWLEIIEGCSLFGRYPSPSLPIPQALAGLGFARSKYCVHLFVPDRSFWVAFLLWSPRPSQIEMLGYQRW
jgi:hypothetical protein